MPLRRPRGVGSSSSGSADATATARNRTPAPHRHNSPAGVPRALTRARDAGLLPSFPFGTDFTEAEQRLIPALQLLQDAQRSPRRLPGLLWQGFRRTPDPADSECLARLGLERPATLSERAYRALVSAALARSRED